MRTLGHFPVAESIEGMGVVASGVPASQCWSHHVTSLSWAPRLLWSLRMGDSGSPGGCRGSWASREGRERPLQPCSVCIGPGAGWDSFQKATREERTPCLGRGSRLVLSVITWHGRQENCDIILHGLTSWSLCLAYVPYILFLNFPAHACLGK
jgi:hypothetical protein